MRYQGAVLGRSGCRLTWRPRGLSKSVVSRVITGVSPFRVLITLLITYLRSPRGLEVGFNILGFGVLFSLM